MDLSVADLIFQLHNNIDSIHACVQSLSDTKVHDAVMEKLEAERNSQISFLQNLHQTETQKRATIQQKEAQSLAALRQKEESELIKRRRREDEERKAKFEQEGKDRRTREKEEDVRRERELEDKKKDVTEDIECELERLEDEMERKIEEGKKALVRLDEKRRTINAKIEAALAARTVVPKIKYKSRARTIGDSTVAMKTAQVDHADLEKSAIIADAEVPNERRSMKSKSNHDQSIEPVQEMKGSDGLMFGRRSILAVGEEVPRDSSPTDQLSNSSEEKQFHSEGSRASLKDIVPEGQETTTKITQECSVTWTPVPDYSNTASNPIVPSTNGSEYASDITVHSPDSVQKVEQESTSSTQVESSPNGIAVGSIEAVEEHLPAIGIKETASQVLAMESRKLEVSVAAQAVSDSQYPKDSKVREDVLIRLNVGYQRESSSTGLHLASKGFMKLKNKDLMLSRLIVNHQLERSFKSNILSSKTSTPAIQLPLNDEALIRRDVGHGGELTSDSTEMAAPQSLTQAGQYDKAIEPATSEDPGQDRMMVRLSIGHRFESISLIYNSSIPSERTQPDYNPDVLLRLGCGSIAKHSSFTNVFSNPSEKTTAEASPDMLFRLGCGSGFKDSPSESASSVPSEGITAESTPDMLFRLGCGSRFKDSSSRTLFSMSSEEATTPEASPDMLFRLGCGSRFKGSSLKSLSSMSPKEEPTSGTSSDMLSRLACGYRFKNLSNVVVEISKETKSDSTGLNTENIFEDRFEDSELPQQTHERNSSTDELELPLYKQHRTSQVIHRTDSGQFACLIDAVRSDVPIVSHLVKKQQVHGIGMPGGGHFSAEILDGYDYGTPEEDNNVEDFLNHRHDEYREHIETYEYAILPSPPTLCPQTPIVHTSELMGLDERSDYSPPSTPGSISSPPRQILENEPTIRQSWMPPDEGLLHHESSEPKAVASPLQQSEFDPLNTPMYPSYTAPKMAVTKLQPRDWQETAENTEIFANEHSSLLSSKEKAEPSLPSPTPAYAFLDSSQPPTSNPTFSQTPTPRSLETLLLKAPSQNTLPTAQTTTFPPPSSLAKAIIPSSNTTSFFQKTHSLFEPSQDFSLPSTRPRSTSFNPTPPAKADTRPSSMIYTRSPVNTEPASIKPSEDEEAFFPRSLDGSAPVQSFSGDNRGQSVDKMGEKEVNGERATANSRGSSFLGGGWRLGALVRRDHSVGAAPLFVGGDEKEDTSGLEY